MVTMDKEKSNERVTDDTSSFVGAPFSKTFYTDGKIIAVSLDGKEAAVEYLDPRDGEVKSRKSANFTRDEPRGYEVGESVWVVLVDEFVFISKKERGCF